MVLFQYHQQSVLLEHTVHLELVFVMRVLWELILVQGRHFALLVQQGTHVMIQASPHKHVPLHSIGIMVERYIYDHHINYYSKKIEPISKVCHNSITQDKT